MKRNYRFRGKALDGSGWVYGILLCLASGAVIRDAAGTEVPVDADTVGESTGKADYDGTEIFEDDVVEMTSILRSSLGMSIVGRVTYFDDVAGYGITGVGERALVWRFGFRNNATVRILGNIHDNPGIDDSGAKHSFRDNDIVRYQDTEWRVEIVGRAYVLHALYGDTDPQELTVTFEEERGQFRYLGFAYEYHFTSQHVPVTA